MPINTDILPRADEPEPDKSTPAERQARVRAAILAGLHAYHEPGEVFEIRALGCALRGSDFEHPRSGYFDDAEHAADAVLLAMQAFRARGWYFTLNPCNPALLARAANRIRKTGKGESTSDGDITRRRWLPLDFDAIRPAGVSATDAEHERALALARYAREVLVGEGWPVPLLADSGNGAHVVFPIDLPNTPEATAHVKRTLEGLAARFDTDEVKIDRLVFNAARIWKLVGSLARKGDHTADRPHRWARLLDGGVR